MSENVGQLFKDWMVASGKSKNTASNYLTGVNTVSNHCGRDVFAIDDLDELERLYLLYGPKGEHAAIGASNSGNVAERPQANGWPITAIAHQSRALIRRKGASNGISFWRAGRCQSCAS
ncbi:hypothetical protein [Stutzerimonas sp. CQPMC-PStu]|uniref:hypothetical protein n=1 Tax=Stutzerimonas sp. CQPMC-PStu TaxID=3369415 RepID=UPI00371B6711